jgi:hypothetical protein
VMSNQERSADRWVAPLDLFYCFAFNGADAGHRTDGSCLATWRVPSRDLALEPAVIQSRPRGRRLVSDAARAEA